jgi:hypothetical protein
MKKLEDSPVASRRGSLNQFVDFGLSQHSGKFVGFDRTTDKSGCNAIDNSSKIEKLKKATERPQICSEPISCPA